MAVRDRGRAAVVLAVVLVAVVAPLAYGDEYGGESRDGAVVVSGSSSTPGGVQPQAAIVEYSQDNLCASGEAQSAYLNSDCTGYANGTPVPDCGDEDPLPPVWERWRVSSEDPWGPWQLAHGWRCPDDPLPAMSEREFRRLPIVPSVLTIQPPRAEVFVNMPTIVYTDPATQTFTTTLIGHLIEVEATPTRFIWDFGDGSDPIVTTSPGHPYPDHDVAYPYPEAGTFTITLTTEFTGRFRIAGTDAWQAVTGTALTVTTSEPITAEEHHTHLVDENCFENPDGFGC